MAEHFLAKKSHAHAIFPTPGHDHERCTSDAIAHAEAACIAREERLTPIRRRVLEALLASHAPLGAYELIDRLANAGARPAPITIYRALDFLREQGLVHRIESRNAFIA
jgi:Fur family zinc uptake transcriptional regulator